MFDTFTHASIDILYILSSLYEKVYFYKPQTSRPGNSEKYIICKKFFSKRYKRFSIFNACDYQFI